jgi:hypothetical protein
MIDHRAVRVGAYASRAWPKGLKEAGELAALSLRLTGFVLMSPPPCSK